MSGIGPAARGPAGKVFFQTRVKMNPDIFFSFQQLKTLFFRLRKFFEALLGLSPDFTPNYYVFLHGSVIFTLLSFTQ